jgi:branched-subunit amino acid ABC-type transport system permease component
VARRRFDQRRASGHSNACALVALGFTLIYNASDVINFARREFVMIGGIAPVFVAAAGRLLAIGRALVAYDRNDDRAPRIR